jgi:uncharacterized surface protein with fasciclin (FAS1) repeats
MKGHPMNVRKFAAPALFALGLSLMPAASALAETKMDIVDTAKSAGSFSTLVVALDKAGLVDTLKGNGPFTVFAPTDEAFAKVPKAQLDALLADKAMLTKVLTYHVVPGKIMAADISSGPAKTAQGQSLTISKQSSGITVDKAKVIKGDIAASNGVIHVIDSVVMPN